MAYWKSLVTFIGTTTDSIPLVDADGGAFYDWSGDGTSQIEGVPNRVVSGDALGTCSEVPFKTHVGLSAYGNLQYQASTDQGAEVHTWGQGGDLYSEADGWFQSPTNAQGTSDRSAPGFPLVYFDGKWQRPADFGGVLPSAGGGLSASSHVAKWMNNIVYSDGPTQEFPAGLCLKSKDFGAAGVLPAFAWSELLHDVGGDYDQLAPIGSSWNTLGHINNHNHHSEVTSSGGEIHHGFVPENAGMNTVSTFDIGPNQYVTKISDSQSKVWLIYNMNKNASSTGDFNTIVNGTGTVGTGTKSSSQSIIESLGEGAETHLWDDLQLLFDGTNNLPVIDNNSPTNSGIAANGYYVPQTVAKWQTATTFFGQYYSDVPEMTLKVSTDQSGESLGSNSDSHVMDAAQSGFKMQIVGQWFCFCHTRVDGDNTNFPNYSDNGDATGAYNALNNFYTLENVGVLGWTSMASDISFQDVTIGARYDSTSDSTEITNMINLIREVDDMDGNSTNASGNADEQCFEGLSTLTVQEAACLNVGTDTGTTTLGNWKSWTSFSLSNNMDDDLENYSPLTQYVGASIGAYPNDDDGPGYGQHQMSWVYKGFASPVRGGGGWSETDPFYLDVKARSGENYDDDVNAPSLADVQEKFSYDSNTGLCNVNFDITQLEDIFEQLPSQALVSLKGSMFNKPGTAVSSNIAGIDGAHDKVLFRIG